MPRGPLSPQHRAAISAGLRRAADGRRRPLSPAHRAAISAGLRRAADGRRKKGRKVAARVREVTPRVATV